MKFPPLAILRWLPEAFEPLSMPIEYGLPFVHVTDTVELALTAVVIRLVPAVAGNVSAAALMEHDAVITIETLKFAVAVPACASNRIGTRQTKTMSSGSNREIARPRRSLSSRIRRTAIDRMRSMLS
jgi:hypothetical protein